MENEQEKEILRRLASIEAKVDAAIATINETRTVLNDAVTGLCTVDRQQRQSIARLGERVLEENTALLALLGDLREMLDPVYDRVFPAFSRFSTELEKIVGRPPG